MNRQLNGELLSTLIQEKRRTEKLNVRDAAAQAGVGFSTLSRLERNTAAMPDLDTLQRVAAWLGVNAAALFARSETVQAHLRAKKRLGSATAEALRELIIRARAQYETDPLAYDESDDSEAEDDTLEEESAALASRSLRNWEDTALDIRKTLKLRADEPLDPFTLRLDRVKRTDARKVVGVSSSALQHLLGPGSSEWSAATIPLRDKKLEWVIVLNDAHNEERRRATLMEEYCHVLLGHDMTSISAHEGVSFRDYRPEFEAEAYYVGAAVLVPEEDLKRRVGAREGADVIAAHYGVSRELVEFRIKRLGLWYAYRAGLTRTS